MNNGINLKKYDKALEKNYYRKMGKIINLVGLALESAGPEAKLGDVCRIYLGENKSQFILAEVVGFRDNKTLLMPFEDTTGIKAGCLVENTEMPLMVPVGEQLLGMVVDGLGRVLDTGEEMTGVPYPVEAKAPEAMSRSLIEEPWVL